MENEPNIDQPTKHPVEDIQTEITNLNLEVIQGENFDIAKINWDKFQNIKNEVQTIVNWLAMPSVYDCFGTGGDAHNLRRECLCNLMKKHGGKSNELLNIIKMNNKVTGNNRAMLTGDLYFIMEQINNFSDIIKETIKELGCLCSDPTAVFIRSLDETIDKDSDCKERMKEKIETIEKFLLQLLENMSI